MKDNNKESSKSFFALCLEEWKYFFRAILLFTFLFLSIIGLIYTISIIFNTYSFKIAANGAELAINYKNNEQRFESILVHPRGWVDSGVNLEKDDKVILSAYGSVNIAFGEMVSSSQYEKRIKAINNDKIEDYLKADIDSIIYTYPWSSPIGLSPSNLKRKGTKAIRIHPESKLGQLLAVVCPGSSCGNLEVPLPPSKKAQIEPYYNINGELQFTVENPGQLRFIVNDVTNLNESKNKLGWQDNIGFFSVNLRVIRKSN